MYRLSTDQKELVSKFKQFTQLSEKYCIQILRQFSWDVERGLDYYFNNASSFPSPSQHNAVRDQLSQLFDSYKQVAVENGADADEDLIQGHGLLKLVEDLKISIENPLILVLAWKFNAKTPNQFTRQEFIEGCLKLQCSSSEDLRSRLSTLQRLVLGTDVDALDTFKEFYRWVFLFFREEGKRDIDKELSMALWGLLLPAEKFPLIDKWIEYCNSEVKRSISKDLWNQLFEFARKIGGDVSKYDPMDPWPTLIDEFVEWLSEQS